MSLTFYHMQSTICHIKFTPARNNILLQLSLWDSNSCNIYAKGMVVLHVQNLMAMFMHKQDGKWILSLLRLIEEYPDSKVHGTNKGPTWVLLAPDGPHVGPMNLAIRVVNSDEMGLGICRYYFSIKDKGMQKVWVTTPAVCSIFPKICTWFYCTLLFCGIF